MLHSLNRYDICVSDVLFDDFLGVLLPSVFLGGVLASCGCLGCYYFVCFSGGVAAVCW